MSLHAWTSQLGKAQSLGQRDSLDRWKALRDDRPVHWVEPTESSRGFWVVPRYEDVVTVARDERLSSAQGNMLISLLNREGDPAGGRILAVMDAPDHSRLRRAMHGTVFREFLRVLPPRVERAAASLITDVLATREPVDFAEGLSDRLPLNTVCDLLGVPVEDREWLLHRSKYALSADEATTSPLESQVARTEIIEYFTHLARNPEPNTLIHAMTEVQEVVPDYESVALNCYGVLIAGDETTRLTLNATVWALAQDKHAWHQLQHGVVDLNAATDEVVRSASAATHFARVATEDLVLANTEIAAGDVVSAWLVSANHDERVFQDPNQLQLQRTANRHLAFGHGPHYCLGAHLARLQIRTVLSLLRSRVRQIEPVGQPQPIYSSFLRGYATMPVYLEPRRAAA